MCLWRVNNVTHLRNPWVGQILIRLRQAVDHPYLVIYSSTKREGMTPAINPTPPPTSSSLTTQASRINGGPRPGKRERGDDDKLLGDTSSDSSDFEGGDKGGQIHDEDGEDDVDDCGICSEPAERPVSAACSHIFCRAWWVLWVPDKGFGLGSFSAIAFYVRVIAAMVFWSWWRPDYVCRPNFALVKTFLGLSCWCDLLHR